MTETEYLEMIEKDMAATTQGPWLAYQEDTEDFDPDEMRWWIQARLPDRTMTDIAVVMEQGDARFFEQSKDYIRELIRIVRRLREESTTRVATQCELDIVLEDNQRLREENSKLRAALHTPTATDVANLAKTLANGTWKRSTP